MSFSQGRKSTNEGAGIIQAQELPVLFHDPVMPENKGSSQRDEEIFPDILDVLSRFDYGFHEIPGQIDVTSVSLNSALKPWESHINKFRASRILLQIQCPKLAKEFFLWAESKQNVVPDTFLYNTLIYALGKAMDSESLDWVVKEMSRKKIQPDIVTFNKLMFGYGKANMCDKVEETWRRMEQCGIQPNVFTYGTIMSFYMKKGMHSKVEKLHLEMRLHGVKPDQVMCNLLLYCCMKTKNVSRAKSIFYKMKAFGPTPDVRTWTTMMNVFGKSGRTLEALEFLEQMKSHGLAPNSFVYTSLIDACGKSGMFSEVDKLLESMAADGIKPDEVLLGSLMNSFGRFGHLQRAAKCFRELMRNGIVPNVQCFTSLMFAFLNQQRYSDAAAVFRAMLKRGLKPTMVTYVNLLSACTVCSEESGVALLLDLMEATEQPVHQILRLLMSVEENEKLDWEEVERLLVRSTEQEKLEDKRSLSDSMIEFVVKCGHLEKAVTLWRIVRMYWGNTIGSLPPQASHWTVDLHEMSERTARVALFAEIDQFRSSFVGNPELPFPAKIFVITGWGRGSKDVGNSMLRQMVKSLLERVEFPFVEKKKRDGFFSADGKDVQKWLSNKGVQRLRANIL